MDCATFFSTGRGKSKDLWGGDGARGGRAGMVFYGVGRGGEACFPRGGLPSLKPNYISSPPGWLCFLLCWWGQCAGWRCWEPRSSLWPGSTYTTTSWQPWKTSSWPSPSSPWPGSTNITTILAARFHLHHHIMAALKNIIMTITIISLALSHHTILAALKNILAARFHHPIMIET